MKSLQTCIDGQEASVAVEQIVAGLGRLIETPVCHTSLIRIPSALKDWRAHPNRRRLEEGLAHASLALEHAEEAQPALTARTKDDNCRRHVGVYALYDWCFGVDPQWLHDLDNDQMTFSHDHGLYFPPVTQAGWTREELLTQVDEPHELPDPRDGTVACI